MERDSSEVVSMTGTVPTLVEGEATDPSMAMAVAVAVAVAVAGADIGRGCKVYKGEGEDGVTLPMQLCFFFSSNFFLSSVSPEAENFMFAYVIDWTPYCSVARHAK